MVHVLLKSCLDEEADLEPLGVAEILLLQQLECFLLIIVPDDHLFDHRQDPGAEAVSWDHGGFFLLLGYICTDELCELLEQDESALLILSLALFSMVPAKG